MTRLPPPPHLIPPTPEGSRKVSQAIDWIDRFQRMALGVDYEAADFADEVCAAGRARGWTMEIVRTGGGITVQRNRKEWEAEVDEALGL